MAAAQVSAVLSVCVVVVCVWKGEGVKESEECVGSQHG